MFSHSLDPEPPFNSQHRNDSFGGASAVRSSHVPSGRSAAIISTTVKFNATTMAQANDLVSCAPTQSNNTRTLQPRGRRGTHGIFAHLAHGARQDLLRRNDGRVADVAQRVGYSSASTFSVAFTRHVGRPPSQYAREEQVATDDSCRQCRAR
jgi:AraC-like DNA-binding protein